LQHVRLVVDHQDPHLGLVHAVASDFGSCILNVVPPPVSDVKDMSPPAARIMDREICSPTPIPFGFWLVNRWNMFARISSGIPFALSVTSMTCADDSSRRLTDIS